MGKAWVGKVRDWVRLNWVGYEIGSDYEMGSISKYGFTYVLGSSFGLGIKGRQDKRKGFNAGWWVHLGAESQNKSNNE